MKKNLLYLSSVVTLLAMTLALSFSAKAATVESEMSKVTLFVEGMMKSRGGVTWLSWPDSVVAALSELAGIELEDVEVILNRDAFTVSYDSSSVTLDEMYSAITDLGYSPGIEEKQVTETDGNDTDAIPEPISAALTTAAVSAKFVLVDFYAQWCIACKALEAETLQNTAVKAALENYIFLKVDTDLYEQAASFYDIVGMPTLLVLNSAGVEIYRSVGLIEPEELSRKLDALIQE